MICESCNNCKGITETKGQYKIACTVKGECPIATMWSEQFKCDDWEERQAEEVKKPDKPNIFVILNPSGRDLAITDSKINSEKELNEKFANSYEYVHLGSFTIRISDISVIAYVGDEE